MTITNVPALKINDILYPETNGLPPLRQRLEQRVVWALLHTLAEFGWQATGVYDGESETKTSSPEEVMELVFNLDEAHVFFRKPGTKKKHHVFLVFGNSPEEVIADWSIGREPDGFDAVMGDFKPEQHI